MSVRQITRIALMSAILYISQIALAGIPNCELVSFFIIIFTLAYGKELYIATFVFSWLEGVTYGFGLWVFSYMYVWPILVTIVLLLRKVIKKEFALWAVVSGCFGLIFGAFFAIAYIPVDRGYALTYWISGLPWDVWHAICNFVIMLVLGNIIYKVVERTKQHAE